MGILDLIRYVKKIRTPEGSIETMAIAYSLYMEKHPEATYDEALLYTIRWRFNRAVFGGSIIYGGPLNGELPDNEIIQILKENDSYGSIYKAAAFVSGMETNSNKGHRYSSTNKISKTSKPDSIKFAEDMELKLTQEDITKGRILFERIMAIAGAISIVLNDLYKKLRVGGGILKGHEISEQLADQTACEAIAYVTAVCTILLEQWSNEPSDFATIIKILEGAQFEVQRVNLRPQYEVYRKRYKVRHSTDSRALPRVLVVHTEFSIRIHELWFLDPTTAKSDVFSSTMHRITSQTESGLRDTLSELWPGKKSYS